MQRVHFAVLAMSLAELAGCKLSPTGCKTVGIPAFEVVVRDARTNVRIERGVLVIIVDKATPTHADTVTSPVTASDSGTILINRAAGTYDLRFERNGYAPTTVT